MIEVKYGDWKLQCDREVTREAYSRIQVCGPETCTCIPCKNFVAVRNQVYPTEFKCFCQKLGIDRICEAEIYHINKLEPKVHFYGGWLHFVGVIVSQPAKQQSLDVKKFPHFSVSFHDHAACVDPVFEGKKLVQLEFFTSAPWVIADVEPE